MDEGQGRVVRKKLSQRKIILKIEIEKYITIPDKIELDPNSEETLASKNITENIKIQVISK